MSNSLLGKRFAPTDYLKLVDEPTSTPIRPCKLKGKADLERFPKLAALVSNLDRLDNEKATIFLHQHYPAKIVKGFPLKAILVPKVTEKIDTNLQKTSPIYALKAIAPSTIFQLAGTGQNAFSSMSDLVKKLPCYILELGTDMQQIPKAIEQLLCELLTE
jgi:hypothetical protein